MSVRVMSWVWEHSASAGADRLVLLAIADAANDAGTDAYPGMGTIARKANVDKRTAQRAVKALVALGELVVAENAGPRGTHRYRVIMTGGRQDATRGDTPPVADHHPGDTPPRQDATVASDPHGGGISSPGGRQDAARTVLEPSKTRPLSSDKPPTSTNDPRFVEFWQTYPRHEAKPNAFKAFVKALKRAPLDQVLAGAARLRDDPNREAQFTPHAATWLNRDGWNDPPLPPRGGQVPAPSRRSSVAEMLRPAGAEW